MNLAPHRHVTEALNFMKICCEKDDISVGLEIKSVSQKGVFFFQEVEVLCIG